MWGFSGESVDNFTAHSWNTSQCSAHKQPCGAGDCWYKLFMVSSNAVVCCLVSWKMAPKILGQEASCAGQQSLGTGGILIESRVGPEDREVRLVPRPPRRKRDWRLTGSLMTSGWINHTRVMKPPWVECRVGRLPNSWVLRSSREAKEAFSLLHT